MTLNISIVTQIIPLSAKNMYQGKKEQKNTREGGGKEKTWKKDLSEEEPTKISEVWL